MVNFDGNLISDTKNNPFNNRAFLYGDAVFETLKVVNNHVLFLEDHYFRLMASMRILRMEIPMNFTLEFLKKQILNTVQSNNITSTARVRFTVYRLGDGFYLPENNNISFVITAKKMDNHLYNLNKTSYEVDLFKDFYVSKHLLSTLKTTNKAINILGSIFAKENGLDNCLLINEEKNITEALQGNVFMINQNNIVTPPISQGCLNGIMRKQIINILKKDTTYNLVEAAISPFDIQKADEIFICNVVNGIQPITKYRKKEFDISCAVYLIEKLNIEIDKLAI